MGFLGYTQFWDTTQRLHFLRQQGASVKRFSEAEAWADRVEPPKTSRAPFGKLAASRKPSTLKHEHRTLNPKPRTLNPEP